MIWIKSRGVFFVFYSRVNNTENIWWQVTINSGNDLVPPGETLPEPVLTQNFGILWRHFVLTYWGLVTHICVNDLTIIGSEHGLTPGCRQVMIWTNARRLLFGPLGTKFSKMLIEIHTFSFKKCISTCRLWNWGHFCLGLNLLTKLWGCIYSHWAHLCYTDTIWVQSNRNNKIVTGSQSNYLYGK